MAASGGCMLSRRHFLQLSASTAGATLATNAFAEEKPATRCAPLPPPISSLTSMKEQATPVTKEERQQRLQRARELMSTKGLDAILIMESTSLTYFTGMHWWGGERLFTMVLPAKAKPFY